MALPDQVTPTESERAVAQALTRIWWPLVVPFAALVARFSFERGCGDPYELLWPVMRRQSGALLIAAFYLGALIWCVTAAVLTIRASQGRGVVPAIREVWGRDRWKVLAMFVVLAIEQMPRAVWHWVYTAARVC
jgi:hypothetical protein